MNRTDCLLAIILELQGKGRQRAEDLAPGQRPDGAQLRCALSRCYAFASRKKIEGVLPEKLRDEVRSLQDSIRLRQGIRNFRR
ncbi:MAG: hypothetical protein ACJ8BW_02960 [Ktedonobacteraceae bacterium]